MVGVLIRRTFAVRCAVVLTAAGFALPLPARCAGCTGGDRDASNSTAKAQSAPARTRPCCAKHPAQHANVAANGDCDRVQSQTCGCSVRPVDRTIVAGDHQTTLPELVAALPGGDIVLTDSTEAVIHAAPVFASLPPPVPHRILHCSWII